MYSKLHQLLSRAVAEFLGTFAIVFFGCGAVGVMTSSSPESLGFVPVIFGGTVAVMVYTIGHLSGAHMNPAVTIAFSMVRHFPLRHVPMYVAMQCFGSFAAAIALTYLVPNIETLAPTLPVVGVTKSIIIEVLLSFFLMFVVMGVATDTRAEGVMAGAAIGMIVTVCAFIGGPLTGASMNPARSLGPALLSGEMSSYYIYVIGPVVGCILAGFTYRFIKCHSEG